MELDIFYNTTFDKNTTNDTEDYFDEFRTCFYYPTAYLKVRFVFVVLFGISVASCSVAGNIALLIMLMLRRAPSANSVYFVALAISDVLFSVAYVLLFPIEILYDRYSNFTLYYAWHSYLRVVYAMGHISQAAANYLVIAVATERYFALVFPRQTAWMSTRVAGQGFTGLVLLLAVISRGATFFELRIIHKPHCEGFKAISVGPSDLSLNQAYAKIYRLWLFHIIQVFLPFIVLIYLNLAITWHCYKTVRRRRVLKLCGLEDIAKQRWRGVSLSTRCLLILVANHLICNSLNLILSIMEHVDPDFLQSHVAFYSLSRDAISFGAVVNCALRPTVYFLSNRHMRFGIFKKIRTHWNNKMSKRRDTQEDVTLSFALLARPRRHGLMPSISLDSNKIDIDGECSKNNNNNLVLAPLANSESDSTIWL